MQNTPIFEENGPDKFKGIDIMRAVRSFDPCLPCGVHMYLGNGKTIETHHFPDVRLAAVRMVGDMSQHRDFQKQLASIAELVRRIEETADPSVRADSRKLVESLMDLHGGGLERALEIISTAGDTGQSIIDRLGRRRIGGQPAGAVWTPSAGFRNQGESGN